MPSFRGEMWTEEMETEKNKERKTVQKTAKYIGYFKCISKRSLSTLFELDDKS